MDKAREGKQEGYICLECDAHLKDKKWPKVITRKLIVSYVLLSVISIPLVTYLEVANHNLSLIVGALVLVVSCLIPILVKPKNLPWYNYELFK